MLRSALTNAEKLAVLDSMDPLPSLYPLVLVGLFTLPIAAQESLPDDSLDELNPTVVQGYLSKYQTWPLSASVVSGDHLESTNRRNTRDVAELIPNFSQTNNGLRAASDVIHMRGLTNTPFFSNPSVVQYVDDVPMGNVYSYANQFHALDRVEVLRGPQGSLFGSNPYAGVINIVTKRPTNSLLGSIAGEYADYDSMSADGYVMGPIVKDRFFFRVGGGYSERDGYLTNRVLNIHPDDQRRVNASGALYWQPNSNWEIQLSASFDEIDDGPPRITSVDGGPFYLDSEIVGEAHQEIHSEALRVAHEGESIEFLSVTAHRSWELGPYFLDHDLSPLPGNKSALDQRQKMISQEFRFSSVEGGDWGVENARIGSGRFS